MLNRPQALNALTLEMIDAMAAQLAAWERRADIKAVIITGAGDKGASAPGGDMKTVHEAKQRGDMGMLEDFYRREYTFNHRLATYELPIMAVMDGVVMGGGGAGIALNCSHPIVTHKTAVRNAGMPHRALPRCGGRPFPQPRLARGGADPGAHRASGWPAEPGHRVRHQRGLPAAQLGHRAGRRLRQVARRRLHAEVRREGGRRRGAPGRGRTGHARHRPGTPGRRPEAVRGADGSAAGITHDA